VTDVSEGEDADVAGTLAGEEVESVLLFIAHKAGQTHSYFSSAADVYRWYGLFAGKWVALPPCARGRRDLRLAWQFYSTRRIIKYVFPALICSRQERGDVL
jgi:hypothetical protein